jgi:hypothetical protein
VPQTVTVTGVNDQVDDGDIAYAIALARRRVRDPNYRRDRSRRRRRVERRRRRRGRLRDARSRASSPRGGGTASFTVVLESQPDRRRGDPRGLERRDRGRVSAASLTFTTADWNVPQTVTVTGVNDQVDDGDIAYSVTLAAPASADPLYAAIDPADVGRRERGRRCAGIDVTPVAGLGTTEAGGTASFIVVLKSQPTADVVIPVASSDPTEGTAAPAALAFTAADWSVPQTITVTGADDLLADGPVAYNVILSEAMSVDPNYSGLDGATWRW